MADIVIFDTTVNMPAVGTISVTVGGKQSYTNGPRLWQASVLLDGTNIGYTGGSGGFTDALTVIAAATNVAAGDHNIKFVWFNDPSVSLSQVNMIIDTSYK